MSNSNPCLGCLISQVGQAVAQGGLDYCGAANCPYTRVFQCNQFYLRMLIVDYGIVEWHTVRLLFVLCLLSLTHWFISMISEIHLFRVPCTRARVNNVSK